VLLRSGEREEAAAALRESAALWTEMELVNWRDRTLEVLAEATTGR
jgi:hypothetical protein